MLASAIANAHTFTLSRHLRVPTAGRVSLSRTWLVVVLRPALALVVAAVAIVRILVVWHVTPVVSVAAIAAIAEGIQVVTQHFQSTSLDAIGCQLCDLLLPRPIAVVLQHQGQNTCHMWGRH